MINNLQSKNVLLLLNKLYYENDLRYEIPYKVIMNSV